MFMVTKIFDIELICVQGGRGEANSRWKRNKLYGFMACEYFLSKMNLLLRISDDLILYIIQQDK